ncbi:hypothetical protein SAMN05444320_104241 [Streptoalloteichus hindustanus]|uniref:Uncharacterized protein n=1 Tax=Streptoalloteichus hindustanus TaxID=2017 RepID=A0A1M5D030_STRHI|nr:hypothetical protein SAMN05444320_104241 [Streptoalloteichus hindustanus]
MDLSTAAPNREMDGVERRRRESNPRTGGFGSRPAFRSSPTVKTVQGTPNSEKPPESVLPMGGSP